MKILIVDDELHIRQGLANLDWASIGIRVCKTAGNGEEAMGMALQMQPDIILSDIKMPGMDGLTMTEQFLKSNPQCAVIFLSGYREFTYARQALSIGAFDYLLKPTNPQEVLECCQRAMEKVDSARRQNVNMAEMKHKLQEMEIKNEFVEPATQPASNNKNHVTRFMEYIDQHYSHELALRDLAEEFHFNAIYINRIIKKETGYTFLEILNNKRMNKATEYLKNPDIKIAEVADLIGIPDQRYFSQIFKKYYGQSPRQYRKLSARKQELP